MFVRVGQWIARHWPWVIGAWLLLAVALHLVAPRWDQVTHDGDLAYLPERMPSVQGEKLLRGGLSQPTVQKRDGDRRRAARRAARRPTTWPWSIAWPTSARSWPRRLPIVDIYTRESEIVGDKLTSRAGPDGQATIVLVQLSNEFMAVDNIRVLDRVLAADASRPSRRKIFRPACGWG